jgi:type IV secretory pathway TraG/TraD family ATPase VirD4
MPDVILGKDVATGQKIPINDIDRRSGLYVLGIQGSGKTTLLKNLIFQDIRNGHGVFFLDPHGDAIDDLLAHIPHHRKDDVFVLDPTDDTHTFGINLFSCLNPDSLRERSASYAQAEHIFTKLFANPQTEELDILLSEYLPNAFYPLIANQGLTLLEIPLLLREKTFRDRLLQSSSIPAETLDFWQEEFELLRADTQREETASTRRRINLFRTHEYVKHIVGQSTTTIDFTDIMDSGKILFVKLSSTLAPRVHELIGTMLVSNLVSAVLRREGIPEAERRHFCIFVDEFQRFASSEDFAVLFTQARKYNVATTVAHQERYGQFADNKRMLGATDTAANKIFLQQSQSDAQTRV